MQLFYTFASLNIPNAGYGCDSYKICVVRSHSVLRQYRFHSLNVGVHYVRYQHMTVYAVFERLPSTGNRVIVTCFFLFVRHGQP